MSDLTDFLAERRVAILAAVRRVFHGSTEPIPEVAPRQGINTPIVTTPACPLVRDHHGYRTRPPAAAKSPGAIHASKKDIQIVPCGTVVKTFFGPGVVMAYIDVGEDPMTHVPPETPAWQLSGGVAKHPACIRRYLIQTTRNNHNWYLFSKAAIVEKQVDLDCYKDELE
jgi:hypothetical protein